MSPFSDGIAAVEKGKKWGYIDRDGKVVVTQSLTTLAHLEAD